MAGISFTSTLTYIPLAAAAAAAIRLRERCSEKSLSAAPKKSGGRGGRSRENIFMFPGGRTGGLKRERRKGKLAAGACVLQASDIRKLVAKKMFFFVSREQSKLPWVANSLGGFCNFSKRSTHLQSLLRCRDI